MFIFCQNLGIYLAGTFLSNGVTLGFPSHWENSLGVISLCVAELALLNILSEETTLAKSP